MVVPLLHAGECGTLLKASSERASLDIADETPFFGRLGTYAEGGEISMFDRYGLVNDLLGVLGSVGLLFTANPVFGTYPLERSHCFGFGAPRGRRPLGLLFRSWGCSEHVIHRSSSEGHLCERWGRQLPGPGTTGPMSCEAAGYSYMHTGHGQWEPKAPTSTWRHSSLLASETRCISRVGGGWLRGSIFGPGAIVNSEGRFWFRVFLPVSQLKLRGFIVYEGWLRVELTSAPTFGLSLLITKAVRPAHDG
jgi:hypothetical protein